MDSAPNKRRKTSPSTHVAANGHETQARLHTGDVEQASDRRASFMSPTKASLARFNPNLLSQQLATKSLRLRDEELDSERQKATGDTIETTHAYGRVGFGECRDLLDEHSGADVQDLRATTNRDNPRNPGNVSPNKTTPFPIVHDPRASPPEEAREAYSAIHATDQERQAPSPLQSGSSMPLAGTSVAPPAYPHSNLPSSPTSRGVLRASSGMGFGDDGEPSLPPTPVNPDLEGPPQPPRELQFSSPSRRPKRKGKAIMKSSPLKYVDDILERSSPSSQSRLSELGPRIYIPTVPQPPPTLDEAAQLKMRDDLARLERELQDIEYRLIRQTLVFKSQHEDSKTTKELAKLRKDGCSRGQKIIRLREEVAQKVTARMVGTDATAMDSARLESADGVPTVRSSQEHSSTYLATPSLTQKLAHFLPFSNRHTSMNHEHPSSHDTEVSQLSDPQISLDGPNAFEVSVANVKLLPSQPHDMLLQRLDLVLSSSDQSLRLQSQVTINIANDNVEDFQVRDISAWADDELGAWLRALSRGTDLLAIGTAFGHYLAKARDRAQCFKASQQEFQALAILHPFHEGRLVSDLYLGQRALAFSRDRVALDIVWLCPIGDDGSVESHISAKAKFPATWSRRTGGAELAKVGEAFDQLVRDRGPLEAIRVIGNLIFPT